MSPIYLDYNATLHQPQSSVVPNIGVEIRQLLGSEGAGRIIHIFSPPLFLGHPARLRCQVAVVFWLSPVSLRALRLRSR